MECREKHWDCQQEADIYCWECSVLPWHSGCLGHRSSCVHTFVRGLWHLSIKGYLFLAQQPAWSPILRGTWRMASPFPCFPHGIVQQVAIATSGHHAEVVTAVAKHCPQRTSLACVLSPATPDLWVINTLSFPRDIMSRTNLLAGSEWTGLKWCKNPSRYQSREQDHAQK